MKTKDRKASGAMQESLRLKSGNLPAVNSDHMNWFLETADGGSHRSQLLYWAKFIEYVYK